MFLSTRVFQQTMMQQSLKTSVKNYTFVDRYGLVIVMNRNMYKKGFQILKTSVNTQSNQLILVQFFQKKNENLCRVCSEENINGITECNY